MRVCLLFANFGPYHVARITALAARCEVVPIEIWHSSSQYLWGTGAFESFRRHTLVSSVESGVVNQSSIRSRLRETLSRCQPDVVAVPGWSEPTSIAAIQWARSVGVPAVMMSESTRQDEPRWHLKEYVKRQVISMCSAALVGGIRHANYMAELGMNRERILDGYDIVDNEHFSKGAAAGRRQADARRRELNLPAHYFLASARLISRKNLLGLIAAYDMYRAKAGAGAWSLVILGYGEQELEIRVEIQRRGLATRVRLAGFQPYDCLPVYYGLAGAFVHAALSEPWGLVVNEAMAAGLLPIVSNACGCAADLIVDGETGFQFDPENRAQLSDLMLRVACNPELRARLSKKAEYKIQDWGPDRFGANLLKAAQIATDQIPVSPGLLANPCLWTLLHRSS